MAKKYEINITQVNEDGTREAVELPHEMVGEGFAVMALTEYEKDGREGVHVACSLRDVSLMMLATAMHNNKFLKEAAMLTTLGGAADNFLGTVDDLFAEEDDAAN